MDRRINGSKSTRVYGHLIVFKNEKNEAKRAISTSLPIRKYINFQSKRRAYSNTSAGIGKSVERNETDRARN